MNEEKKAERIIERTADGNNETGNKSSANSIIERADAAAERLAKENERMEANNRRQEELMARKALGGESSGAQEPVKPKDVTDKEFLAKFIKGEIENPFK